MADQRDGGIAWTDQSWNPVRGCTRVSEGCRNCYAEVMAARFSDPGQPYHGLAKRTPSGPRWTGQVRLIEEHLEDPFRWKRPRRVFVNSMSDLFHEGLSDEDIERVFAVMALATQHTFQVLTKRAARMREWFHSRELESRASFVARAAEHVGGVVFDARGSAPENYLLANGGCPPAAELTRRRPFPGWPLPNVWLGVSVEDQQRADERIPLLLETPAAVRFVSYEPALGPVDFERIQWPGKHRIDALRGGTCEMPPIPGFVNHSDLARLDWVIVGGESGPGARPFDLRWARAVVAQCKAAGVACFVKQLGSKAGSVEDGHLWSQITTRSRKGDDPSEWPEDLRVRQFPESFPSDREPSQEARA